MHSAQEDWSLQLDGDIQAEAALGERQQEVWRGNSLVHEAAHKEGRLSATRHALMAIYRARHGEVPDDIGEAIFACTQVEVLQGWLEPFVTDDPELLRLLV